MRSAVRRRLSGISGCPGIGIVLAYLVATSPAAAQQSFGRDRPLPEAGPPASFDFTIQAPRRSPVPRSVEALTFAVTDIEVTGITAFSPDRIRPLTQPVIGKTVHLAELLAVAEAIEAQYHSAGYVLSQAFVPTQSVSNGIFHISVVEGYVAAVSAEGADPAARTQVEALMAPVLASRPLRLDVIESALLAANELPGLTVSGLLRPSASNPGASDLVLTVGGSEVTAQLSIDNRGAPTTGVWTWAADASVRSPFGDPGLLTLDASAAPDVNLRRAVQLKYALPVGEGATATLSGLISHGAPAGALGPLQLISDSIAVGPRLTWPLMLARHEKLGVEAGLTWQSADVQALGAPLSHDEWRDLDVALTYQNSAWLDGITNLTLDLAHGLPILGASAAGGPSLSRAGGQPDFTKVSGIARRVQTLDTRLSGSAVLVGQYAFDTLLTGEEVSFGGAQLGRGYDPASLTGDSGVGAALELRYDLDSAQFGLDSAQAYGFFDNARAWSRTGAGSGGKLESAGLGVRAGGFGMVNSAVELARTMIPLPNGGSRAWRLFFNASIKY